VAAESAPAPGTPAAGKIDIADNTPAHESTCVSGNDLPDEFMAGSAAKAVVAALELQVGITDATAQKANQREPVRPFRERTMPDRDPAILKMDCDHIPPLNQ
jgi:hypothetical protein